MSSLYFVFEGLPSARYIFRVFRLVMNDQRVSKLSLRLYWQVKPNLPDKICLM